MKQAAILFALALIGSTAAAQTKAPLPALPAPQSIPQPAAKTDGPYAPQAILPGGIVVPLFAPNSPYLKADRIQLPEVYNLSQTVHGRINSIVSIHNPSIEVHKVDKSINTGTAVIVIAGGGHRTLNVGGEAADFVPFFYNYGINTIILRNRLRADGYIAEVDAVRDAQQAVRVVRAYAKEFNIDPNRIGVMGFSAARSLQLPRLCSTKTGTRKIMIRLIRSQVLPRGRTSSESSTLVQRPLRNRTAPPVPKNVPPAFLVCGSAGDRVHTIWALEYYQAMLSAGVPNVELHLYGNGRHPGDPLPDGSRMSGGLTDRNGIPYGTWQFRFIDWARDLGFLQKPGAETKAAKDVAAYVANPPRPIGQGRAATGRGGRDPASGAPAVPGTAPAGTLPAGARRDN